MSENENNNNIDNFNSFNNISEEELKDDIIEIIPEEPFSYNMPPPEDIYNGAAAIIEEPKEEPVYRWSMAEVENSLYKKKTKKARKNIGLKIFAVIMSIMFLFSAASAAYLILEHSGIISNLLDNSGGGDKNSVPPVLSNQEALDETKNSPAGSAIEDTLITIPQENAGSKILTTEEAIAKVKPSVVCIETELEMPGYYGNWGGGRSYTQQGVGTGFIVSEDGYIATNYHVVENATKITVTLNSGEKYDAELIGGDALADLAIVKINAKNLPVVKLGDSDALQQGQDVVAIGTPAGIEFAGTATKGIVSAINRDVDVNGQKRMTVIQTDASINPGNSGGPLINMKGEVIGITSMKLASTQYEGMGFAIPINTAINTLNEIIANPGRINNPQSGGSSAEDKSNVSFGLEGFTVTEEDSAMYNIPQGWKITKIAEGGPCYNSGLQLSDIIIKLDGKTVTCTEDLYELKMNYKPGDKVTVTIYRNGDIYDFQITLGAR